MREKNNLQRAGNLIVGGERNQRRILRGKQHDQTCVSEPPSRRNGKETAPSKPASEVIS